MPKIVGEVDSEKVLAKLAQLERLGRDFREPMTQAGLYMMSETMKRFQAEMTPLGKEWERLEDSTKKQRRKGKKTKYGDRILQDTGTLRDSLSSQTHANAIFRVSQHSVEMGTNVPYAGIHQFGFSGTVKSTVRHRLNEDGSLARQKKYSNLAIFARKTHKNVREKMVSKKLNIPARPFLGINEKNQKKINRIFNVWADKELKKG